MLFGLIVGLIFGLILLGMGFLLMKIGYFLFRRDGIVIGLVMTVVFGMFLWLYGTALAAIAGNWLDVFMFGIAFGFVGVGSVWQEFKKMREEVVM